MPLSPYLILMERVGSKSDKNLSGLCRLVRNLLKPSMGSSMSVDQEEVTDQNYDFSYQVKYYANHKNVQLCMDFGETFLANSLQRGENSY